MKPNNKFKALYNPFTRNLLVMYGDAITEHTFEDVDEWTTVSFDGDENHPNYLHIQLDYDETFQLLFYPYAHQRNGRIVRQPFRLYKINIPFSPHPKIPEILWNSFQAQKTACYAMISKQPKYMT